VPIDSLIVMLVALLFFSLNPQYLFATIWTAVWCSPRIFPWDPLIYLLLYLQFFKHSKHFLSADTIKIAHSIPLVCRHYQNYYSMSSATDSTLPQPDIDSIRCQCAANLMLTKLKSSPLQGKIIQSIIFTNYVINAQLIRTSSKIWGFFGYCILY